LGYEIFICRIDNIYHLHKRIKCKKEISIKLLNTNLALVSLIISFHQSLPG